MKISFPSTSWLTTLVQGIPTSIGPLSNHRTQVRLIEVRQARGGKAPARITDDALKPATRLQRVVAALASKYALTTQQRFLLEELNAARLGVAHSGYSYLIGKPPSRGVMQAKREPAVVSLSELALGDPKMELALVELEKWAINQRPSTPTVPFAHLSQQARTALLNATVFPKLNLTNKTVTAAQLSGVTCLEANLNGATLVGANFKGANLGFLSCMDTDLSGADLTDLDWTIADFTGAELKGATLSFSTLIWSGSTHREVFFWVGKIITLGYCTPLTPSMTFTLRSRWVRCARW